MGVPRPAEAKPPIPGTQTSSGSEPNSKVINTLPLSHFPSILWQKNPAKVLIPIDRAREGYPQLQIRKHPRKPETPKKPLPPTIHQKIYFRANKKRIILPCLKHRLTSVKAKAIISLKSANGRRGASEASSPWGSIHRVPRQNIWAR